MAVVKSLLKMLAAGVSLAALMGAASAEPLKIAMIEALSGPAAQTGIAFTEGMRYGVARINEAGGFNGDKVQLIEYDNQGGPTGAADKLKTAIADGARVISSASSSAVAAQLTEDIRKYNLRNPGKEIIYYNVGSEAYELTAERCHFWFFRMGSNPYVRMQALVKVMKETGVLGTKVYSINQNYSYGHDMQAAQARAVKEAGATVVEAVLHDVNKIQDFSPYMAKIKASGAETVLTGNWANDIILLLKAAGDAGSKVRFGNTSLDTPGTLGNAGPAALGSYLVKIYNLEAGGEKGKAFIEDFKTRIGHYPYSEEPTAVFALMLLGEALKTVDFKGGAIDAKALALAIETASWESPIGPWSVRKDDHQAILPITVSEVSKAATHKVDGTDMGFKLLKVVDAKTAAIEVAPSCKMQRPN
ncbi:ABC transporter substrate-binding protein [Bradyrhizobium sp. U87765 SZCCT0131]|uniref:ABC transporter substrate-binding protein n=1 Tax=unclassified Bradyrhizobium TaxID=2631580 RepID=UPI001BA7886A|nr:MULTISPECIES: ABC transporter substrate-binding protein [unclassified Bradyrhizobium]MBR1222489.1 ABC transporter substrate-binding protein [Bradyrhizobium sp. U87765 SZCCT0131]MBR1265430.1 ABC transporter substrate-binding protein [Bradyrhizobium sp. U87765 SZCCT0134]MBR1302791.1 ABC transporter substrate-binding protein [Bradyrhizobium sp. U87765 SZCCT0110]MBR1323489.1 ABC transporter substrate-binding protein [Bradyrhizobium sp. U87765 SZCCT0109]MBR1346720.1 ABC transporter substrate-bin